MNEDCEDCEECENMGYYEVYCPTCNGVESCIFCHDGVNHEFCDCYRGQELKEDAMP